LIKKGGDIMPSPIMRATEVAELMNISPNTAYKIIKQFNEELKAKGFYIVAGRISRKYFYERTGLELPDAGGKGND